MDQETYYENSYKMPLRMPHASHNVSAWMLYKDDYKSCERELKFIRKNHSHHMYFSRDTCSTLLIMHTLLTSMQPDRHSVQLSALDVVYQYT
jgi:hypothetical protein